MGDKRKKVITALHHPYYAVELILNQLATFVSDENYVKWKYYLNFRKKLHLDNPQTYNEKLQWLKLHDQHDEYTQMVDKYEAKKYVASIIGEEYIIPTYGVYNSFEEIDFASLPQQFVLKCTHNSGGVFVCKDKLTFDIEGARKQVNKWLKKNPYWKNREYPYKNVKPRIIIEQYMEDESGYELKDYKFFCFNGVVKCLKVDYNRYIDHHANYYDRNMNLLPFGEVVCTPNFNHIIEKPKNFEKMIEFAEKLSNGMSFLRVDFYNIKGKIYFGELTFFPASGMGKFTSEEWDYTLGSWIKLPKEKRI